MQDYSSAIEICKLLSTGTPFDLEDIINIQKRLKATDKEIPLKNSMGRMNVFQKWCVTIDPDYPKIVIKVPDGVGVKTYMNYSGIVHNATIVCDEFNKKDYYKTNLKFPVYSKKEFFEEIIYKIEEERALNSSNLYPPIYIKTQKFDESISYDFKILKAPSGGFVSYPIMKYFCNEVSDNYKFHQIMTGEQIRMIDAAKEILSRT